MLHLDGAWQASRGWKALSRLTAAWSDALFLLTSSGELKGAYKSPLSFVQFAERVLVASFASPNEVVWTANWRPALLIVSGLAKTVALESQLPCCYCRSRL